MCTNELLDIKIEYISQDLEHTIYNKKYFRNAKLLLVFKKGTEFAKVSHLFLI